MLWVPALTRSPRAVESAGSAATVEPPAGCDLWELRAEQDRSFSG